MKRQRTTIETALLAAVLLTIYVAIAWLVADNRTLSADISVSRYVQAHTPGWLVSVFAGITLLGTIPVTAGIAIVIAALLWRKHRTEAVLALAILLTHAINYALKSIVPRHRPDGAIVHIHHSYFETAGASFPSGHAMAAVAIYGFFALLALRRLRSPFWRGALVVGTALLCIAIGLSRVVLGVHWGADVLAGFAAGGLILLLYAELHRRFVPVAEPSTPPHYGSLRDH